MTGLYTSSTCTGGWVTEPRVQQGLSNVSFIRCFLTMAVPTAPSHLRRRDQMPPPSDGTKARLFLALACLWPLLFVVMSIGSEPNNDTGPVSPTKVVNPGLSVRKYLDRVDVMGYGPTHPRVAVVVVGDDRAKIVSSIESVFR